MHVKDRIKKNLLEEDSSLNPHKSAMLNDFKLYSVHADSAEIESSLFLVKIDYG